MDGEDREAGRVKATLIGACWAGVVLSWLASPQRRIVPARPSGSGVVRSIGRISRQGPALRWASALDSTDDVAIGATTAFGSTLAIAAPALGVLALVCGWTALVSRARRRQRPIVVDPLDVSTVTDLLVIAAAAGLGLRAACEALSGRVDPPFDEAVAAAMAILRSGGDQTVAIRHLFGPAGQPGERVASSITDAARDGIALGTVLARASDDLERLGRRRAEQRAKRLPVRLLFPLVCCALPSFVLLSVVPLLAGSVGSIPF